VEIVSLTALNFKGIADFSADAPRDGVFVVADSRYNADHLFDMVQTLLAGCDDEAAKSMIGPQNSYAAISCVIDHEGQRYYIDRRMSSAGCTLTINGRYYPGKTPVFQTVCGRGAHFMSRDRREFVQKFASGLSAAPDAGPFDYGEAEKRLEELESQLMSLSDELDKSRQRQTELLELSSRYDAISREITGLDNQIRFEQAFLSEAASMNRLKDNMLFLQRIAQQAQILNRYKKWLPDIQRSYDQLKMRVESLQRIEGEAERPAPPEPYDAPRPERELPEVMKYAAEIDAMDPDSAADSDTLMDNMLKVQLDRVNDEVKNTCSLHVARERGGSISLSMLRSIDIDELSENIRRYQEVNEHLVQINGMLSFKASIIKGPAAKVIFEVLGILMVLLALLYQFSAEITGAVPAVSGVMEVLVYYLNYVGIFAIHPPFMLLGAGALFIALAILSWVLKRGSVKRKLERQNEDMLSQAESIKNDIIKGLNGLPLKDTYFDNINRTIETAVKELTDVYQKQAVLCEKTTLQAPNAPASRADELAQLLIGETADARTNILALKNLLDAARRAAAEPVPEPAPVRGAAAVVQNPSQELAAAAAELAELEGLLGENPRAEAQRLNELTSGIKKAISIRDNIIKKTPNFKETAARLSALSGKGWPYGEQEVSASRSRHEQYLKSRAELARRSAEIKDEIDRLASLPSPVHIDANIMEIQNRVETAAVRHDIQVLAKSVLSPDDEAQQSRIHDLSRTASKYIGMLTNGVADTVSISAGGVSAQSEAAYEAAYLAIMESAEPGIPLILSGPLYAEPGGLEAARAVSAKRQTLVLK